MVPFNERKSLKDEKPEVAARLLQEAIAFAYKEVKNVSYGPRGGCGRVYVDFGKMRANSKVLKALGSVGKMFSRPGFTWKQLYVGYDNATGFEYKIGELIADYFKERGYHAYADGDGD